uniref:Uncharacterized protein n=1 Tax=Setaria viridis TaxID=4556 RepID=A0A4U6VBM7_SETVI|nr:hypothetical protein SEVIR_3G215800v2 [Setaria viridis]
MAAAGEEDEAAWRSAIADAASASTSTSAATTLVLDGTVKSSTGRLPSPSLFSCVAGSLVELSIANSGLTSLAGLPLLPKLLRLYLPRNRLSGATSLDAIRGSCGATLRLLNIGDNLRRCYRLAPSLDLNGCPITNFLGYRQNIFQLIPSLKKLDGRDEQGDITAGACFEGGAHLISLTQSAALAYGYHPRKIVPRIVLIGKREPPLPESLDPSFPDSTALSLLHEKLSKLADKLLGIVDAAFFCKEAISLQEYFREAKSTQDKIGNRLLKYVKLPEKETKKLKVTDEACAVLSSWVQCFTAVLASDHSWNGKFNLSHFILLRGQVYALKKPNPQLAQSGENKLDVNVMYQIKIKFHGFLSCKKVDFFNLLSECMIDRNWTNKLGKVDIFKKILLWGHEVKDDAHGRNLVKKMLSSDLTGYAFFLIRNFGNHVSRNNVVDDKKEYKDDDGTELLIPNTFGDFVADMLFDLLEDTIGQLKKCESPKVSDLEIEKIAKDCIVSPIQILYEVKHASSIIKIQDSGISYGVNEECNVDKATEKKGGEDEGCSTRNKQLERMAKLSAFLSHQIRSLSAKLGLVVTNEVLEVEALQEKLGISSFEVRNAASQDENMGAWVSSSSLETPYRNGSLHLPNMGSGS